MCSIQIHEIKKHNKYLVVKEWFYNYFQQMFESYYLHKNINKEKLIKAPFNNEDGKFVENQLLFWEVRRWDK